MGALRHLLRPSLGRKYPLGGVRQGHDGMHRVYLSAGLEGRVPHGVCPDCTLARRTVSLASGRKARLFGLNPICNFVSSLYLVRTPLCLVIDNEFSVSWISRAPPLDMAPCAQP